MSAGTDVTGTDASMTSGTGLYFDGQTSARQVAQDRNVASSPAAPS